MAIIFNNTCRNDYWGINAVSMGADLSTAPFRNKTITQVKAQIALGTGSPASRTLTLSFIDASTYTATTFDSQTVTLSVDPTYTEVTFTNSTGLSTGANGSYIVVNSSSNVLVGMAHKINCPSTDTACDLVEGSGSSWTVQTNYNPTWEIEDTSTPSSNPTLLPPPPIVLGGF